MKDAVVKSEWVKCPECGSDNTSVRGCMDLSPSEVWCNDCNHEGRIL